MHPSCSECGNTRAAFDLVGLWNLSLVPGREMRGQVPAGPEEQEENASAECGCSSLIPRRHSAVWPGNWPSWQRLVALGRRGFSFSILHFVLFPFLAFYPVLVPHYEVFAMNSCFAQSQPVLAEFAVGTADRGMSKNCS